MRVERHTVSAAFSTTGYIIATPPLKALDLFCHGLLRFKNSSSQATQAKRYSQASKLSKKTLGVAYMATGIAGFALLLPAYITGQTLRAIGDPKLRHLAPAEGASASEEVENPVERMPGSLSLFNLNAALGGKILYPVNFGGTPFGEISLKNRANQIVDLILNEQADVVTLQEVFDPKIGRHIARRLSEIGYEAFYNAGSSYKGMVGFNSGLLTAVRIRDEIEVEKCDFHAYSDSANVDRFAAKGVLLVKCLIDGQEVVIANTHTMASDPEFGKEIRIRDAQIQEARAWIQDFAEDAPTLFCGDFNCHDHGVNQGKEWLANEKNEAFGISDTARDYLKEFAENYRFKNPAEDSSLPFEVMLVGSGVEDAYFATQFSEILQALSQESKPETALTPALFYFFKRLLRDRYAMPDIKLPLDQLLQKLDPLLQKEVKLVAENRLLPVPTPENLEETIAILLQGRDQADILSELKILEPILAAQGLDTSNWQEMTSEELRDELSSLIPWLLSGEVPIEELPDALIAVNEMNFYRELQKTIFGKNRNDRVFHQKKGLSGFYTVRYEFSNLSDHLPITGIYQIENKLGKQEM
ncbi:MAG: hypothetical protein K0S07_1542 [Chlamydiales bacterium]|jgi:endonuclease/exonuclease/phosphatase family metal-dependent hydrolase|nr:hypothetical protein [Chlamydiales bacterium]